MKPSGHDSVHSEEELKLIVAQSYEGGEINQTELAYLKNIFAFDERQLKDIMIPKADMITLEKHQSVDDMIEVIDKYDYTRYPINDLSNQADDFIGFINTKEMLTSIAAGRNGKIDDFIHEIPRFKQSISIKDVFLKMQQTRTHMAIVTDEKGVCVGLVTMEDILSEIVGEIRDELDGNEMLATTS